jgi:hypothetical protein
MTGRNAYPTCGTETALTFSIMQKSRRELPWWLEVGTEVCPACNHLYLYETEYRCFDCDGPLCPMCVVETTAVHISCPGCCDGTERALPARGPRESKVEVA